MPEGAHYDAGDDRLPPNSNKSRVCCCCLFTNSLKLLIGATILLGSLALVLWLVLRPNNIDVFVSRASLTRFNLTTHGNNENELEFSVGTEVAIRNPNRKVGVYYDWLELGIFYQERQFSWVAVHGFYQGPKNTTTLFSSYGGRLGLHLDSTGVRSFQRQSQAGSFDVALRLRGRAKFGVGSIKTPRRNVRANCFLAIPYEPYHATGRTSSGTKCDVEWWD